MYLIRHIRLRAHLLFSINTKVDLTCVTNGLFLLLYHHYHHHHHLSEIYLLETEIHS